MLPGARRNGGNSLAAGKKDSVTANALRDLKQGIDSNAKFGQMVSYSIECVGRLAVDRNSVEEIARSGCVASSLTALKTGKNPSNEPLQGTLNAALLRACGDDPERSQQVSNAINGDFEPFANSLRNHKDRDVIASTSRFVARMGKLIDPAARAANIEAMKRHGIFDALADRVASCPADDPDLLASLLEALGAGAHDKEVAEMLMRKGIYQKVLDALAKNPNHAPLALASANLFGAASGASEIVARHLRDIGVPAELARLCQRFPGWGALEQASARAMGNIMGTNEVAQVIAQLRVPDVPFSQLRDATAALATMLLSEKLIPVVHSQGGLQVLLPVFLRAANAIANVSDPQHANAVAVFSASALALARALNGVENHVYTALKGGVAVPLTHALSSLASALRGSSGALAGTAELGSVTRGRLDALAAGVAALAALVTRPANVTFLEKKDAFVCALQSAQPYLAHAGLARAVGDLVAALAKHGVGTSAADQTASRATIDNMIAATVGTIKAHPGEAAYAEGCAVRLGDTAAHEAVIMAALDGGAAEALVGIINDFNDDPDAIVAALVALEKLARLPTGAARLRALGVVELLGKLERKYRDHPLIPALCRRLLSALTSAAPEPPAKPAPQISEPALAAFVGGPQPSMAAMMGVGGLDPKLAALLGDMQALAGTAGKGNSQPHTPSVMTPRVDTATQRAGFNFGAERGHSVLHGHAGGASVAGHKAGSSSASSSAYGRGMEGLPPEMAAALAAQGIILDFAVPEKENAEYGAHLADVLAKIQAMVTARQPGRLLNFYEMLLTPNYGNLDPIDRDFLLGATLAALAAVADEAADAEEEAGLVDIVPEGEGSPVLWELHTALVEFPTLERILASANRVRTTEPALAAIIVDDVAAILSLVRRPETDACLIDTGMEPEEVPGADALMGAGRTRAGKSIPPAVVGAAIESVAAAVEVMRDAWQAHAAARRAAAAERRAAAAASTRNAAAAIEARNAAAAQAKAEAIESRARELADARRKEFQDKIAEARGKIDDLEKQKRQAAEEARKLKAQAALAAARAAADARLALEKAIADGYRPSQVPGADPSRRGASRYADVSAGQNPAELDPSFVGAAAAQGMYAQAVLNDAAKEFLMVGSVLQKHGRHEVSSRHVYLTPNCEFLVFKEHGEVDVKRRHMIRVSCISEVIPGRYAPRLETNFQGGGDGSLVGTRGGGVVPGTQASNADRRSVYVSEGFGTSAHMKVYEGEACFTLCGIDLDSNERDIGFEAPNPETARTWVKHLNALLEFMRQSNRFHEEETMVMNENPLHALVQHEKQVQELMEAYEDAGGDVDSFSNDVNSYYH